MPAQPPVPPAARSPFGPEGEPKTLHDVSHRVRHAADRAERHGEPARSAPDASAAIALAKVAAAVVFGYALGAIVHRHPTPRADSAPARPRPQIVAASRAPRSGASSIRFR